MALFVGSFQTTLLLFLLLLLPSNSQSLVSSRRSFSRTSTKPGSGSILTSIAETNSLQACLISCSAHDSCRASSWQDNSCVLYTSAAGSDPLEPGELAVAEKSRSDRLEDSQVPTEDISASVISYFGADFRKEHLVDGDLTSEFATGNHWVGGWVELTFPETLLRRVTLYHRCYRHSQCSSLEFSFSDPRDTKQISRGCTGLTDGDCSLVPPEDYELSPVVQTSRVRVVCTASVCNVFYAWGFREIQLWEVWEKSLFLR